MQPLALSARHDRECRRAQATQAAHRGSGGGHGAAGRDGGDSLGPGLADAAARLDLECDPSAPARDHSRTQLNDSVCECAPDRRAAGGSAQRTRRRADCARASWLAGCSAALRDRRAAEGRADSRAVRDFDAGTRHRHGRGGPGDSDRVAAVGGQRHAAHRPRRPPCGCGKRGNSVSQIPCRSGGLRRRDARHARRPHRVHALSAQSARRAGQQLVAIVASAGKRTGTKGQGTGKKQDRGREQQTQPIASLDGSTRSTPSSSAKLRCARSLR